MEILDLLSRPEYVAEDRRTALQQRQSEVVYLTALELSVDIQNVLHVTGTKGKGSTCVMIEAMLRRCGYRTGLFTSPHLYHPRERVCINGHPIEAETFWEAVRWCYDRLKIIKDVPTPGYFRFLMYVALRLFGRSIVDVVILEVGIGGRYDPTNFVRSPVACGIASIGMDHQELLGETLREIAWNKGGIMKSGASVWTVPQKAEAMMVLRQCADDVNIILNLARPSNYYNWHEIEDRRLTGYQLENASLAVSLASAFEKHRRSSSYRRQGIKRLELLDEGQIPKAYLHGLSSFEWKGRAQVIRPPRFHPDLEIGHSSSLLGFYLDGAHTPESIEACCNWAIEEWKDSNGLDFVLFNCHRTKDPSVLLGRLHECMTSHQRRPHRMFFAPLLTERPSLLPISTSMGHLEWQKRQREAWKTIANNTNMTSPRPDLSVRLPSLDGFVTNKTAANSAISIQGHVFRSLSLGMKWFVDVANMHRGIPVRVLVTGSLYFVSDVLKLIDGSST